MTAAMTLMRTRDRQHIQTEEQYQNIRAAPYPGKPDNIAEPARGGAHGKQYGQCAQTESEH